MRLPNRICELIVSSPEGRARKWAFPLYFTANINKVSGNEPNTCDLTVYNLSDESLHWVELPGHRMEIRAGDDVPMTLFQGDITIRKVKTTWDKTDRVTEIKGGDGRRSFRDSAVSVSYPPDTRRSTILNDMITALGVPRGHIDLPEKTYKNGYAFSGRTRWGLSDLLGRDARWTINNGLLDILPRGKSLPARALLLAPHSGLIGSPTRTDTGVDCEVVLEPKLDVNCQYVVKSAEIDGLFRATRITHDVSSDGAAWTTTVVGVPSD